MDKLDATNSAEAPKTNDRRWIAMIGIVGLVAILAGFGSAAPALTGSDAGKSSIRDEAAASETEDRAAELERRVEADPKDWKAWAALGAAYVDRAKNGADPSAYPLAEAALGRGAALRTEPTYEIVAGRAALAAGRHDFRLALELAEQAEALKPLSAFVAGVRVDALTELGRFPESVAATQAMVDRRPNLSSLARVSYQRELHGDIEGAVAAMEEAMRAAGTPGDRSFAAYHLGEVEWGRGRLDAAAAHYQEALRHDPASSSAIAGLGKVEAARGDVKAAIARYETATASFPDPELLKELGELHVAANDAGAAEKAFAAAAHANAEQARYGVGVNLEIALLSADLNRDLEKGLAAAEAEWARRQSVHVADALAWQLFRNGRHAEALAMSDEALRIGTRNAAFLFHRAEILRSLGRSADALRAYEDARSINPYFSFALAPLLEQRIAELTATP